MFIRFFNIAKIQFNHMDPGSNWYCYKNEIYKFTSMFVIRGKLSIIQYDTFFSIAQNLC